MSVILQCHRHRAAPGSISPPFSRADLVLSCIGRTRSASGRALAVTTPDHWDCAAWIGLSIYGTKRLTIGNLPRRLTIPS